MSIFLIGLALWIVILLAVGTLVLLGVRAHPPSRIEVVLWAVAVAAAVLLLFRPHEDILGGQDQGAYINTAFVFNRQQALTYVDPLLARVPAETRQAFFYGYRYFPDTKYMCLWVSDVDRAIVAPWFQPAYAILLGVVAHLAPAAWVLYVNPLLTILAAAALAALARRLWPHPAAALSAFALAVANPIVVWHGRSARAETAAGLFLIAGAALLLNAWTAQGRRARLSACLAGLCTAAAPFVHITAWLAVLPLAMLAALHVLARGRTLFGYLVLTFLGGVGFLVHTVTVTDCYYLGHVFHPLRPPGLALIGGGLLALAILYRLAPRGGPRPDGTVLGLPPTQGARFRVLLPAALTAGTAALILLSWHGILDVPETWDAHPILRHIQFTEWRPFVMTLSPALAGVAGLGWLVFLWRGGPRQPQRLAAALILLPGLMLMGEMPILMYFLRRSVLYMVPAAVLGLTGLVVLFPARSRGRWGAFASAVLVAGIVALGIPGREPLYTLTDYDGLYRFLAPFARTVRDANGILLAEYSRYAAPLEHIFGIPTLGLDSDRRMHYEKPFDAWAAIMRADPDRPAYFITPYGPPLDDRFLFDPVRSQTFAPAFLETVTRSLPVHLRRDPVCLTLYRMHLRENGGRSRREPLPYVRTLDPGNVGLRHFSHGRTRLWRISGIYFNPGETQSLHVEDDLLDIEAREMLLFFLCDRVTAPRPPTVSFENGVRIAAVEWTRLVDNWWVLRLALDPHRMPPMAYVTASDPMQLSSANALTKDRSVSIPPQYVKYRRRYMPLYARWTKSLAEIAVPVPPEGHGIVLLFVNASRPAGFERPRFRVYAGSDTPRCYRKLESRWVWQACPLSASQEPDTIEWVRLHTDPPWDSGYPALPENLGVLVRHVVVLPSMRVNIQAGSPGDG
jgi:hypothetical protein